MRVAIHTQIQQAMRVLIHTHISCRLLVEGSAPQAPFEHRISFCGYAFCERFERVRRSAVPLRCHGTNRPTLTPDGYCETQ